MFNRKYLMYVSWYDIITWVKWVHTFNAVKPMEIKEKEWVHFICFIFEIFFLYFVFSMASTEVFMAPTWITSLLEVSILLFFLGRETLTFWIYLQKASFFKYPSNYLKVWYALFRLFIQNLSELISNLLIPCCNWAKTNL